MAEAIAGLSESQVEALLDQVSDAALTAGLVVVNILVGVFREARAKRQLEQSALLDRPRAAVIREGAERSVDPAGIVVGDLLVVRAGDQIAVDGQVVGSQEMGSRTAGILCGLSSVHPTQAMPPRCRRRVEGQNSFLQGESAHPFRFLPSRRRGEPPRHSL